MPLVSSTLEVGDIYGPRVQLDKPLQASVVTITVTALIPTGDPPRMQEPATNFWWKFWNANPEVDLQEVANILLFPSFAARSIKPNKARGPDSWSNFELKTRRKTLKLSSLSSSIALRKHPSGLNPCSIPRWPCWPKPRMQRICHKCAPLQC